MRCSLISLPANFLPDLNAIDDYEISQSLEDFAFGKDSFSIDDTAFIRDTTHAFDDDDGDDFGNAQDFGNPMDVDEISGSAAPPEDFFVGDQAIPEDFGPDFGVEYGGDGDNVSVNGSEGARGQSRPGGPLVAFDPRRVPGERERVMAINDEEGMMDYFDSTYLKNWAGPEHWKLRKVVRRRKSPCHSLHRRPTDACM